MSGYFRLTRKILHSSFLHSCFLFPCCEVSEQEIPLVFIILLFSKIYMSFRLFVGIYSTQCLFSRFAALAKHHRSTCFRRRQSAANPPNCRIARHHQNKCCTYTSHCTYFFIHTELSFQANPQRFSAGKYQRLHELTRNTPVIPVSFIPVAIKIKMYSVSIDERMRNSTKRTKGQGKIWNYRKKYVTSHRKS